MLTFQQFDPRDPEALAHSGTFNNNTLGMHAGYVAMSQIYTPEVCVEFNALGNWLLAQLSDLTKGTKACFTGISTIISLHITDVGVQSLTRGEDVVERSDLRDLFWMEMMEKGFWITRRGSIAVTLGTPKEELERFVGSVKSFLDKYAHLMSVK
jgi:glutamate-1-semialdehyde 2,1-aminomutase